MNIENPKGVNMLPVGLANTRISANSLIIDSRVGKHKLPIHPYVGSRYNVEGCGHGLLDFHVLTC